MPYAQHVPQRRNYSDASGPTAAAVPAKPGRFVRIVEVGPRDGLQNEPTLVPTRTKVELIHRLAQTGLRTIEATSFVSKKHIPQLADAHEVMYGVRALGAGSYIGFPVLVPTERHLEDALAAGAKEVAVFAAASEAFSRRNINCTRQESLARFAPVARRALDKGVRVRGYISCVIACPYDGPVAVQDVAWLCRELLGMGCYEISLGDTTGVGTPGTWRRLLDHLVKDAGIAPARLALHCHDTYGQALANCAVGLDYGVRVFDASVAGLGGCPFAKGATGNLATEDLVYMLQGSGFDTGVDLLQLANIGDWISKELHRQNGSRAGAAILKRAKL